MLSMHLPLLPPPSTSLLPSLGPYTADHSSSSSTAPNQNNPRRPGQPHRQAPPIHSKNSLHTLSLDERTITQRKMAIAMYGYSWLKPAGLQKTMLGRREEELEREEAERLSREAEREEELREMGAEEERVGQLREQAREGEVVGIGDRDLDEDVPDMDQDAGLDEELEEMEEDEMEGDLDDDVPDADVGTSSPFHYDSRREPDTDEEIEDEGMDVEGETGITDDVEASHLHSGGHRPPTQLSAQLNPARHQPLHQQRLVSMNRPPGPRLVGLGATHGLGRGVDDEESAAAAAQAQAEAEAEALANAMLDEDELGEVEHNLDDEIPEAVDRDLDDDVPEPDDGGEWEHTDTELDLEPDLSLLDSSEMDMDVSGLGVQTRSQVRNRRSDVASTAVPFQTPAHEAQHARTGGRMSWLGSASARRTLFGRGPVGTGLFSRRNITPPQVSPGASSVQRPRRRSGRSLRGRVGGVGTGDGENVVQGRESLD